MRKWSWHLKCLEYADISVKYTYCIEAQMWKKNKDSIMITTKQRNVLRASSIKLSVQYGPP